MTREVLTRERWMDADAGRTARRRRIRRWIGWIAAVVVGIAAVQVLVLTRVVGATPGAIAIGLVVTIPYLVPIALIALACRHDAAIDAGNATVEGRRRCRACGHFMPMSQTRCPECGVGGDDEVTRPRDLSGA
ncbi:MAG: hypothetical protein KDA25_11185 [Phycisphaerales bacterium]|nr:hypothetical protein [Phycisphaerales bacterium]